MQKKILKSIFPVILLIIQLVACFQVNKTYAYEKYISNTANVPTETLSLELQMLNRFEDDVLNDSRDALSDTDYGLIKSFINKEYPPTKTAAPLSVNGVGQYEYGYHGVISGPGFSAGVSLAGQPNEQSFIDNNYAAVMCEHFGRLGLSNKGGRAALVAAHNNIGPFKGLGSTVVGSTITMQTSYGTFTYTVTNTFVGSHDDVANTATSGSYDLVVYTCYPFDATVTDQRYIVGADLN